MLPKSSIERVQTYGRLKMLCFMILKIFYRIYNAIIALETHYEFVMGMMATVIFFFNSITSLTPAFVSAAGTQWTPFQNDCGQ